MDSFVFTEAQKTDIRRFCGYPDYGNGDGGFYTDRYFEVSGVLEYRLNNLSQTEGAVIVAIFLTKLYTLETDIVSASDNLDTDSAAVWFHNKNEVRDRIRLFNFWCMRLCQRLDVPYGGGNSSSGAYAQRIV